VEVTTDVLAVATSDGLAELECCGRTRDTRPADLVFDPTSAC
jgi:hypothetical protein